MEGESGETGWIQFMKDLLCPNNTNTLGLYFLSNEEPMEYLNQGATRSVLIVLEQVTFREQSLLNRPSHFFLTTFVHFSPQQVFSTCYEQRTV